MNTDNELERLRLELAEARETNARLNRRVQAIEADPKNYVHTVTRHYIRQDIEGEFTHKIVALSDSYEKKFAAYKTGVRICLRHMVAKGTITTGALITFEEFVLKHGLYVASIGRPE